MRGLFFGGALAGILLGFWLGLAFAWSYWPVSYSNADPADLRLDLKDDYLIMIAASYGLDGDMARAMQRLGTLDLAQRDAYISDLVRREPQPTYQQALIHLALDLRQPFVALARPTFTPRPNWARRQARPQPTALPHRTATPAPPIPTLPPTTAEPTSPPSTSVPNPDAPLYLVQSKSTLNCSDTRGRGLIEVDVQDVDGRPVPGIGVEVNWSAGDEVFYTGLKPERGMGYADIEVSPGAYSVRLTGDARSDVIENLQVDDEPGECTRQAAQLRGWKLVFQRSG